MDAGRKKRTGPQSYEPQGTFSQGNPSDTDIPTTQNGGRITLNATAVLTQEHVKPMRKRLCSTPHNFGRSATLGRARAPQSQLSLKTEK